MAIIRKAEPAEFNMRPGEKTVEDVMKRLAPAGGFRSEPLPEGAKVFETVDELAKHLAGVCGFKQVPDWRRWRDEKLSM